MTINTIFVIEDDALFAKLFVKRLEKLGAFKINHFESAEKAIDSLLVFKPELIFLDHLLKGINGVDALPIFKEILPECLVVIVSNQLDIKVLEQAFENGAENYFQKNGQLFDYAKGLINDKI